MLTLLFPKKSVTLGIASFLLLLGGCSTETDQTAATTATETAAPATLSTAISLDKPYVRAMPPEHPNSAMFVTLHNTSEQPVRLVSAATSVAETVELHAHSHKDGMMKMYQVEHIEIPAQGSVALKPGGLHIMLFGLKKTLSAGDDIEISLNFDDNSSVKAKVPVKAIQPQ